MARARNIKPSFFQDDKLGELDPLSRLAFIGMWTVADFKGCIEFRPRMMKVQLLPYDECDIDVIVSNLEKARFIRYYSVQGKRYIKIVNFEKHQNPHKNEKEAGSDLPDHQENYNENSVLEEIGTKPDLIGTDRADSLFPLPDSLNPLPDSRKARTSALACPPEIDQQIWDDWLSLRKAKRAPVTEKVLNAAKPEAGKAGMTLEAFWQEWVSRGSQG